MLFHLALRFILQRNVRIADWIYCNSTAEDDIGDTEESFRGYLKEKIETDEIVSCRDTPSIQRAQSRDDTVSSRPVQSQQAADQHDDRRTVYHE